MGYNCINFGIHIIFFIYSSFNSFILVTWHWGIQRMAQVHNTWGFFQVMWTSAATGIGPLISENMLLICNLVPSWSWHKLAQNITQDNDEIVLSKLEISDLFRPLVKSPAYFTFPLIPILFRGGHFDHVIF